MISGPACHGATAQHSSDRPLKWALALVGTFFTLELVGGWWTGSLALVADAMHTGIDSIGLAMSLIAARMSLLPPDPRRTFGYQRVEVLAALGNGVALLVANGVILREAITRWDMPTPVAAPQMIAIAVAGLLCNMTSGIILYSSSRDNLNMRGAFLHVAFDALGCLSAIAAGVIMFKIRWYRADPLASMLICVATALAAISLMRGAVGILLESAPAHLDLSLIRAALEGLDGVKEVHDLHVWSLTQGSETMSGHLIVKSEQNSAAILQAASNLLRERFGLSHVTLQIET